MEVKCAKENRKRGRPATGFDKKAYNREYMRKKRQALKKTSKA